MAGQGVSYGMAIVRLKHWSERNYGRLHPIDNFLSTSTMVANALIQANAYTDATASRLEDEIQEVSLGQITLYDPTTGTMNNLQVVIDNIYSASREEALTATEYDSLELTATNYDAEELTAFNYDRYGKTLLMV